MSYQIMLVDDHPMYRLGLYRVLQETEDLDVVVDTDSPRIAWNEFQNKFFDLIILDLSFGDDSGVSLINKVRDNSSNCPILVLSMHDETFWAERLIQEGANGYVMKDENNDVILSAIRTVLDGDVYLAPNIQQQILRRMSTQATEANSVSSLSTREQEIFKCMGQNLRTSEIAQKLFISVKTVQTHQANIKKKLDLKSLTELRILAVEFIIP